MIYDLNRSEESSTTTEYLIIVSLINTKPRSRCQVFREVEFNHNSRGVTVCDIWCDITKKLKLSGNGNTIFSQNLQ